MRRRIDKIYISDNHDRYIHSYIQTVDFVDGVVNQMYPACLIENDCDNCAYLEPHRLKTVAFAFPHYKVNNIPIFPYKCRKRIKDTIPIC